jgi:hypothetical protein
MENEDMDNNSHEDDESGGTAELAVKLNMVKKGGGVCTDASKVSKQGTIVTPANLRQVLHQQDSEASNHERMVGLSRDKRKQLVKAFVKDTLFHTIKFLSSEKEMHYEYAHFADPIMKHMGVNKDERERWWEENKQDAKKAMAERRASITGAMKQTVKGTWIKLAPASWVLLTAACKN